LETKFNLWSETDLFVKNPSFWQTKTWEETDQNYGQKSKFWSKIEILVKNQNFGQKSKFS